MILIKKLTLRNFLSIGNVEQEINFNNKDLTLILGENLDLGGNDAGSRNGTGKTSMLQGLSYALFGNAINNIKKDNLINRTNERNMSVSLEFSVRGIEYKIVRARKPNLLKFYVNDKEQVSTDDSQGDSRETQDAIERVLCMSGTMFQHIIGLNSYTTAFLSLKVGEQREVIEQLLGITLLSEKANAIKELIKKTKEDVAAEEYRIHGIDEANKRIQEQIDSLKRRQGLWKKKYDADLAYLVEQYDTLSKIDIEAELLAHKDLLLYTERQRQYDAYQSILARQTAWKNKNSQELAELERNLTERATIDIESELQGHRDLVVYNQRAGAKAELEKLIARGVADERRENLVLEKLRAEVEELKAHKCYACGQDFHDDKHTSVLSEKQRALQEAALQALATNTQLIENTAQLQELGELGVQSVTHYKTEAEAVRHSSEVENIVRQIEAKRCEIDPYAEQLNEHTLVVVGVKPKTRYKTEAEAIEHKNKIANLETQIIAKNNETDPYTEQIAEMTETGIQVISYDEINRLNKLFSHQDYLLDLLTNKKSFVRKRIIEQNLSYLNSRLTHYLTKMGLPHRVVFQNDLSVEITELGRDMDFDNLSRGERNRLILSLSFAFRDVYESLYSPINLLFVDELIDNGLDTIGVENSLALLKDMVRRRNKSIWLVSHREELVSRVDSVLKVVKENGYTNYQTMDTE